jgi:eukaryotic-like serine/threonine-protein kinase
VMAASDQYPPGYVIDQSPPAGTSAPGGSLVTITVSNGKATAEVPDVLDRTEADALSALQGDGFQVKVVHQTEPKSPGAGARKGRVWKQTPGGQTSAEVGATVTIYVNPG